MKEEKYLYYYSHFGENLYRGKVLRETKSNVWIQTLFGAELKISKKTYSTGSPYNRTHYYMETPEIIIEYTKSLIKRKYQKKLKELEKCNIPEIMEIVINIDFPKKEEKDED